MKVIATEYFANQFKKQVPKKIWRILWPKVLFFLESYQYQENENIGHGFLKIRFEEAGALRGKKLRIICFVVIRNDELFPLTVYAKKDHSTMLEKEIQYHLNRVMQEVSKNQLYLLR